ncbi:MAG: acyltransferase [Eubacterium sp.]|nr:acyltransferase [Eubacterium sp.]
MSFTREDTQKVKGFAILLMIFHHLYYSPERYEGKTVIFSPFSEAAVNFVSKQSKICVAIFAFLSVYGMTLSYLKKNRELTFTRRETEELVLRRYIRMIGGFAFVLLVLVAAGFVVQPHRFFDIYGTNAVTLIYFLVDLSGLAELFQTPTYYHTFWYMSLAVIFIFLLPAALQLYRKFGAAVLIAVSLLIAVMFPTIEGNNYADFPKYVCCLAGGIIAAERNWIGRICDWQPGGSRIMKPALETAVFLGLFCLRKYVSVVPVRFLCDGFIPVIVCALFAGYINKIPGISRLLDVFGKYSMTIFLIHNFIRRVWGYHFTYWFRYWWLIFLVLAVDSLIGAIVITWLKKLIRYQKLVDWIERKVMNRLEIA